MRTELDVIAYQRSQLLRAAGYPGRVTDVYAAEGEFVTVGAKLMQIGLLIDPEIVVYVEPKHAQRLRPGSGASVTFPDGSVLGARVTARPFLTRRLPPEQVGSLGVRTISVVVTLAPETSWPKEQLIHGLPLEVRFHHGWEAEWRRAVVSVGSDPSGTPTALTARSDPMSPDPMIPDGTPPETIPAEILARSQRHYDALLNGLAAVVWEMDAETLRLTFTSRNIEAVFGHPYERWVQDRDFWVKRLHPEDRSRALEACTRAIALRRSFTLEYRMQRADGRALWVRDLVSFATGPDGRDLLRGVMVDITENREAEEALKRRIATLETEVAALTQTPPSNGRC